MKYNERSLYALPAAASPDPKSPPSIQLVLLLRGARSRLSAALCRLPVVRLAPFSSWSWRSCRSGVGDAFMNLVEVVADFSATSDPRMCEWSTPVVSTLPDSGSRTCVGPLFAPDGSGGGSGTTSKATGATTNSSSGGGGKYTHYMVGNQIDSGRDPVTLSLARDGLQWDVQWAVRYGAPPVRYPGRAKGKGFQYPGAYIDTGEKKRAYKGLFVCELLPLCITCLSNYALNVSLLQTRTR
jgi:hypothetical protein